MKSTVWFKAAALRKTNGLDKGCSFVLLSSLFVSGYRVLVVETSGRTSVPLTPPPHTHTPPGVIACSFSQVYKSWIGVLVTNCYEFILNGFGSDFEHQNLKICSWWWTLSSVHKLKAVKPMITEPGNWDQISQMITWPGQYVVMVSYRWC